MDPNRRPLSLQPPPGPRRGPRDLAEAIQRIRAMPGGFRGRGRNQVPASAAPADQAVEAEAASDVEMRVAHQRLVRNITDAHNASKRSAELISLLLSRDNPSQGAANVSPELRNVVGLGTLGATVLDRPSTLIQDRVPDNKMIAIGKRLLDCSKNANTASSAAARLQQETALETKYWGEVLAVSEKGWSTGRQRDEPPETMRVKFGFSNAAPAFKAASTAVMKRSEDGSVRLEHGKPGAELERLQVTILQDGVLVGRSSLPRPLSGNVPLEDQVKEARNTRFAQELWQELNVEGRTLIGHGVQLEKSAVTYAINPTKSMVFRLVALDQDESSSAMPSGTEDDIAEMANITLQLLLSNAHRQTEKRRAGQSTPGADRGHEPPYALLLPIITSLRHEQTIKSCSESLLAVTRLLRSAGLESSFTMTELPVSFSTRSVPSETLAANLMRPPDVQFDLIITQDSRLRIMAKPSSKFGTRFSVHLLPPTRPGSQNHLSESFPPASPDPNNQWNDGMYDNTEQLFWYIHNAVPRALVLHCKPITNKVKSSENGGDPSSNWVIDISGTRLIDDATGRFGVKFDFRLNDVSGYPELHVTGDLIEQGKPAQRNWKWSTDQDQLSGGNLDDIVTTILSNGPRS
ncbi:subunit 17 of mediator complex-domain-containing protein [Apodospora peruviana]|uniref:Mediator of RNA polymerase II transcription subunit 17 n=1 Tax=Apodospora peruviana TaxID=516989 RepID=A0AAE0MG80_9PEZI|nr:subunit 17 of mediator complex-domain-containing protein [Apodospora peruviana]